MNRFRVVDTRFRILKGGKIGLAMSVAMIGGMLTLSSTSANADVGYFGTTAANVSTFGGELNNLGQTGADNILYYQTATNSASTNETRNSTVFENVYFDPTSYATSTYTSVGSAITDWSDSTDYHVAAVTLGSIPTFTLTFENGTNATNIIKNSMTEYSASTRDIINEVSRYDLYLDAAFISSYTANLIFNGVNTVSGYTDIDAGNINILGGATFAGTVNAGSVDISTSSQVTFNSLLDLTAGTTDALKFYNGGNVVLNNGLNGNVDFNGQNATVTLSNGNINGNIDTSLSGSGTVKFTTSTSSTVSGDMGFTANLKEVIIEGTGSVTVNGDVATNLLTYNSAGTFDVNSLDTTRTDSTLGTVNFKEFDGTLKISSGDLTANVVTDLNNNGIVTMVGDSWSPVTQNITGTIGASTKKIKTLNIGESSGGTYADTRAHGDIYAQTVMLNNAYGSDGEDSTLSMVADKSIYSTVQTSHAGMGILTLEGGDQIVTGDVGKYNNGIRFDIDAFESVDGVNTFINQHLAEVDSGANGANSTFQGNVYATTVNNTGAGTTTFEKEVIATTINVADGTSNFNSGIYANTTNIASGIANFNGGEDGDAATNIVFSESSASDGVMDHGLNSTSAIANLNMWLVSSSAHNGLGNINFGTSDATVNIANYIKVDSGNITSTGNHGYVNFLASADIGHANISESGAMHVKGINIGTEEQGTVTIFGNVTASEDIWLHNDSIMVLGAGSDIGIVAQGRDSAAAAVDAAKVWTNVGTMSEGTGTLIITSADKEVVTTYDVDHNPIYGNDLVVINGPQTINGNVGVIFDATADEYVRKDLASVQLLNATEWVDTVNGWAPVEIAGNANVTFEGMVFANTLMLTGNDTVTLNGQNSDAYGLSDDATEGMVGTVAFHTNSSGSFADHGAGHLIIGDSVNLTTGTNGIKFSYANNATLTFAGSSIVTGVLGGNTTGRSTFSKIYAGADSSEVTFTDDVYVMEGTVAPTTFHVSGTGTVNFQGNLNGDLVYNADGTVNVSDAKSILVSTVPVAVTTLTDGTGTLNYLGSTTLDTDIGESTAMLKSVTFNSASNNVTQTIDKNIYSDTVTIGNGEATTAATIGSIAFGGTLIASNDTTTLNFGTSHVAVGGDFYTNNATMNFTVTPNDTIATPETLADLAHSAKVIVAGALEMTGAEKINIDYTHSISNSGTYALIESASTPSVDSAYDHTEGDGKVTDNNDYVTTSVKQWTADDALTYNVGDLVLIADRTAGGDHAAADNYAVVSGTIGSYSQPASQVLGAIAGTGEQSDDMTLLIRTLDANQGTQAEKATQMRRLAPIVNGSIVQSAMLSNTLTLNTVSNRIADLRGDVRLASNAVSGMSAGDEMAKNGVWIKMLGSTAKQDKNNEYDGYKTKSAGFAMGIDRKFGNDVTAGLALGVTRTNIDQTGDIQSAAGTTNVDSYQVVAYASKDIGNAYVEGALTYATHSTDLKRMNAASTVSTANVDANQMGARLAGGYRIALSGKNTLTPFISAEYTRLTQDAYTENAPASAGALSVDKYTSDRLTAGLGLRFASQIDGATTKWHPELKVGAYQYMGVDSTDVKAQFVAGGGQFVTPGTELDKTTYNVGLGLKAEMTKATSLGVSIDYDRSSDGLFQGYTGQFVARYEF